MKAVETVEKMVDKILSDREKEKTALEETITKEDAAIEAAEKQLDAATASGDEAAYLKAKSEYREARDLKEMHKRRLNTLNDKPLISKIDYEKAVADIFTEIAALDDQKKQQLAKLSEQMEKEALSLQAEIDHANEVLGKLQHDVYKDADKTSKGAYKELMENKKIDKWNTYAWGMAGVKHFEYASYTGRKC